MTSTVVAVLGTGTMGAGMVSSLRRAGLPVRMWNRSPDKARALTGTGAQAFGSPADAVEGADVVLTMVFDADAAIEVIRATAPATGTIWLQNSTVGVEGADRTVAAAEEQVPHSRSRWPAGWGSTPRTSWPRSTAARWIPRTHM